MAQSGYTPILIYASGTASAVPSAANLTSSANGAELALNYADGKLYYKNSSGVVTLLAQAGGSLLGQTDSATPFETALGYQAGDVNTGTFNTFIGYQSGRLNTTAIKNTAVGYRALASTVTGEENVAVGHSALFNNTVNFNTAVGVQALFSNVSGTQNTAVGAYALSSSTGANNVGVGYRALNTTTGNFNTAVGTDVLYSFTTGQYVTAVGYRAGYAVTGNSNTIIGCLAGYTGTNNLTSGTNNTLIGYNVAASSATVSNEVTIGNTEVTSTRLRGMVQLNAAMFEQATVSATAATGTINFDARTQSVLYYTSNASANWTLNVRGASGVSLDSIMSTGQSLTIAFLCTNGSTAYYQSGFQVDSVSVTPKWQGGTAPTSGNASSVDIYAITIVKTGSATFTAFASQTKFA